MGKAESRLELVMIAIGFVLMISLFFLHFGEASNPEQLLRTKRIIFSFCLGVDLLYVFTLLKAFIVEDSVFTDYRFWTGMTAAAIFSLGGLLSGYMPWIVGRPLAKNELAVLFSNDKVLVDNMHAMMFNAIIYTFIWFAASLLAAMLIWLIIGLATNRLKHRT